MAREPLPWDIRERPMTKKMTLEQKWRKQMEAAKKAAEKLPYGKERDALMRTVRKLETASQINQWLSSPALTAAEVERLGQTFLPAQTRQKMTPARRGNLR